MTGRSACPSAVQLFEAYSLDRKVKPSTIARQRVVFPAVDAWLEAEGLTTVTLDNDAAQRWIDKVAAEGRAAKTIKDVWLAAPRAVFAWAKRKRKLRRTDNPFEGLTVEKHRPTVTRKKEFTEAETQTIRRAALALRNIPSTHTGKLVPVEAARRWVPWLCAYTGARVGEMTQLRACDVGRQACGPLSPSGTCRAEQIPTLSLEQQRNSCFCHTAGRANRLPALDEEPVLSRDVSVSPSLERPRNAGSVSARLPCLRRWVVHSSPPRSWGRVRRPHHGCPPRYAHAPPGASTYAAMHDLVGCVCRSRPGRGPKERGLPAHVRQAPGLCRPCRC
jgi:hypothetical protein